MIAKQQLDNNNFVPLPGFIEPDRAKALADEFRKHVADHNRTGDNQIPTSRADYNFIGFLELLCEKTPEISKLIGEHVLPTYCYARVYHQGSELTRHRDRDACEVSVTLHLDGKDQWPISIQKPNGDEVTLNLDSGDGMMYLGCDADHWRDKFEGDDYVQVFLHYVKSRGDRSYAYFDKNKNKPAEKQLATPTTQHGADVSMNLKDYIIVIENAIPPELCDRILAEYKECDDWVATTVGEGVVKRDIRNADTIGVSHEVVIDRNEQERRLIDNALFECAHTAIIEYNKNFPNARIERDSGYDLLRYTAGGFYTQHVDSFIHAPRSVSCSFTLNDDFEGGQFAFFNGTEIYTPPKGSALMFPSNFQYPHEVMQVTEGTRYSIVTWFI